MPMPIEPTATVDDDAPPAADRDWDTLPNYVWTALTNWPRPRRDSGDEEIEAGAVRRRGPVPRTIDVVRASEEERPLRPPLASGAKATTIEAAAAARRRDAEGPRADPVPNEGIASMVPKTTEAVEDDDFRVSKPKNSTNERRITIEFELSTDFSLSAPTLLGRSGVRWDLDSEEGDSSDASSESSGEGDRYLDDLILAQ